MTTISSPPKRRTYHHGDLRNAMLQETRKALKDVSPQALSLRAIARRAGVSEAAPFRHFSGMNDLLAEVAAQGFREMGVERQKLLESHGTARRKLYLMMRCYVDFARRERGLFGLMVGPRILNREIYTAMQEASRTSFEMFAGAVRTFAIEQGWPSEALSLLLHASWAVEHGVARLIIDDRIPFPGYEVDLDAMVDFSVGLLVSGIEGGPHRLPARHF
jgi:AcrR family transcriptional regulator